MANRRYGRALLIVATGFWVCVWGSLQSATPANATFRLAAQEDAETGGKSATVKKANRHASRSWKRHASRKSKKIASRSTYRKVASADAKLDDGGIPAALPAEVENANARFDSDDTASESAKMMSARANALNQTVDQPEPAALQVAEATDSRLVSADQLNDVDRALTENNAAPPGQKVALSSANVPVTVSYPIMASTDDTAWGKSSILGKVFIAIGGLLTFASAARMFMT